MWANQTSRVHNIQPTSHSITWRL